MLLKHIFSNINISNILTHVKKYFNNNHFLHIEESIQKFLACSIDKAFIVYQCPLCGGAHKFKISCKSRLCPACGKKYDALWADKTAASLINTKHRAVLFTIPKEIREFFFYDRTLLTKLTYAVNDIFKYQFNNIKSKNQRVHKIGRYSKKYFHVDSIAGQRKKLVIDIVKSGNYENKNLKKKAQIITSSLYKKIRDFSDNKITFYYEDLSNNKEKVEVTMDVEKFLFYIINSYFYFFY